MLILTGVKGLCWERPGGTVERWAGCTFFGLSMPVPYFISSIVIFESRKVFE